MEEYITVKYGVATIKRYQRVRLFLLMPFFFIFAILFLMGSYASVLGTICVVMLCWVSWGYFHWRKLLKGATEAMGDIK